MNPIILEKIDDICKNDNNLRLFLREIVILETNESPGWWKPIYRETIEKHIEK